jgi:hypothetical protein
MCGPTRQPRCVNKCLMDIIIRLFWHWSVSSSSSFTSSFPSNSAHSVAVPPGGTTIFSNVFLKYFIIVYILIIAVTVFAVCTLPSSALMSMISILTCSMRYWRTRSEKWTRKWGNLTALSRWTIHSSSRCDANCLNCLILLIWGSKSLAAVFASSCTLYTYVVQCVIGCACIYRVEKTAILTIILASRIVILVSSSAILYCV